MAIGWLVLTSAWTALAAGWYPDRPDFLYPRWWSERPPKDSFLQSRMETGGISMEEEVDWPPGGIFKDIRQVAAVDVDQRGDVHVFHRGDRAWDARSFAGDVFRLGELGPIRVDTVLILNRTTGEVIRSWGKNRFYLPHGLTLDRHENSWITDVALHQVFKFSADGREPSVVLGEKFTPGSDRTHFCKPTDVAVASSGVIFVSDGYCNSRIVAFEPDGTFHGEFGQSDRMAVPHGLSLMEERKRLCVADRENARILCYSLREDASLGDLIRNYDVPTGAVYAIAHRGENMLAVTVSYQREPGATGITLRLSDGNIIDDWNSYQGFSMPHDVAVSSDGKFLYVADVDVASSKKIYKFAVVDVNLK